MMGFFRPILSEIFPEGKRKIVLVIPLIINKALTRDAVINKTFSVYMEKTVANIDAVIANKALQEHSAKTFRFFKTRQTDFTPPPYLSPEDCPPSDDSIK